MAKDFAKDFYNSPAWKRVRKLYKRDMLGICERCNSNVDLKIHHKIYLTPQNINDPKITMSFSNLELLCINCHNKEHFVKYSAVDDSLKFNDNGELVRIDIPPV